MKKIPFWLFFEILCFTIISKTCTKIIEIMYNCSKTCTALIFSMPKLIFGSFWPDKSKENVILILNHSSKGMPKMPKCPKRLRFWAIQFLRAIENFTCPKRLNLWAKVLGNIFLGKKSMNFIWYLDRETCVDDMIIVTHLKKITFSHNFCKKYKFNSKSD